MKKISLVNNSSGDVLGLLEIGEYISLLVLVALCYKLVVPLVDGTCIAFLLQAENLVVLLVLTKERM